MLDFVSPKGVTA